jgi:hypothetical protein
MEARVPGFPPAFSAHVGPGEESVLFSKNSFYISVILPIHMQEPCGPQLSAGDIC